MGLHFYDSTKTVFTSTDVLRSTHDGYGGGVDEQLIYIRNDDSSRYFTNMVISYTSPTGEDTGEFGTTGWGTKFMYGERRPTEAEWDLVRSGDSLTLPNIGSTAATDTSTYTPVWVRFSCPGGSAAQIRDGQNLTLSYFERLVGA